MNQTMQPKKKQKGGLIAVIIVLGLVIAGIVGAVSSSSKDNPSPSVPNVETPIVFDAMAYAVVDNKNISEAELIEKLGKPDSIEEWNFKTPGKSYPIRTLYYGADEYLFNNENLQRINLGGEFQYESKDDFLKMFGLKKYKNTKINDTNFAYRATNCGIHDLWLQYEDGTVSMVKITYGNVFGD